MFISGTLGTVIGDFCSHNMGLDDAGASILLSPIVAVEQSRSERDRHRFLMRPPCAIARHAAVGPRMALYRAVESRPVMAAGMMTRECVGRKSI